MEIKIKELVACSKCHRLKGEVFEKYNGIVPVLCICDLKEGKHSKIKTSIVGGIIPSGKIHIMWTPTCNYFDENGKSWHVPHFAGFGWGSGKNEDAEKLERWITEHSGINEYFDPWI
jgi:hypothetical protein